LSQTVRPETSDIEDACYSIIYSMLIEPWVVGYFEL
jgi:hypothetical protein